eukprot:scaffold159488_cov31-Prasinocladus_malaysianus.AAC.1
MGSTMTCAGDPSVFSLCCSVKADMTRLMADDDSGDRAEFISMADNDQKERDSADIYIDSRSDISTSQWQLNALSDIRLQALEQAAHTTRHCQFGATDTAAWPTLYPPLTFTATPGPQTAWILKLVNA